MGGGGKGWEGKGFLRHEEVTSGAACITSVCSVGTHLQIQLRDKDLQSRLTLVPSLLRAHEIVTEKERPLL